MAKAKKSKKKVAENPDDTSAPAKSGKRGFLSQLSLMLTLGAASFGTVFFLPTQSVTDHTGETASQEEVHEESLDITPELSFVELSPLTLSLDGGTTLLKIGITLEVLGTAADIIDPDNPQIRDAFTLYLRALRPEQIRDAAFMVQLRAQLLHRAQLILGREGIHGVLITDFLVQ